LLRCLTVGKSKKEESGEEGEGGDRKQDVDDEEAEDGEGWRSIESEMRRRRGSQI